MTEEANSCYCCCGWWWWWWWWNKTAKRSRHFTEDLLFSLSVKVIQVSLLHFDTDLYYPLIFSSDYQPLHALFRQRW